MANPSSISHKSTIVRAGKATALGAMRTSFQLLERTAPGVGARWAERLWFTIPANGSVQHGRTVPEQRFEVSVHGRRVVGEARGDGPPVYLVHGWGGRRAQLDALVGPLLAAGHKVVGFDAPSHGESEPGPAGRRRSTIPEFADALAAVVAAHGPARGIVAHSLGCTATAVAIRRGVPVDRLVFVAPMADPMPYTHVFARQLGFGERVRTRMVKRVERRVGTTMSSFDVPAMAPKLAAHPLLLVHDRDDPETRWSDSEAIAQCWPGARLLTTAGLGHRRALRAPDVVAEIAAFMGTAHR
jgi:pimeloyl-ACP methyl ester carboxylesterase